MKLSVSNIAWSAEQDEQVYEIMEKHGFSGLEIAPTRIFPQRPYEDPAAAAKWAGELKSGHGLTVSSMQSIWYGVQEKLFGTDAERGYLTDYTKKAIDFAAAVKCANLVFGCPRNRYLLEGADKDTAILFFRELGEYALLHGAVIAMEANPPVYNTNYINTTWQAMELTELVHSAGFRINLDTGTMLENKEPLVWLEGNVKMIHHVHISEPGLGKIQERPLHRELAELLKAENYQGFVSVEMGRREQISEIEEVCGYVKEIFG